LDMHDQAGGQKCVVALAVFMPHPPPHPPHTQCLSQGHHPRGGHRCHAVRHTAPHQGCTCMHEQVPAMSMLHLNPVSLHMISAPVSAKTSTMLWRTYSPGSMVITWPACSCLQARSGSLRGGAILCLRLRQQTLALPTKIQSVCN
jgi:hypothetical protein